jgi:polysaccharide pyruvyl transferase WcaK-like protein
MDNDLKMLAEVADSCIEKMNATVAFIPHIQAKGLYVNEVEVLKKIIHYMKHRDKARVITSNYTAEEIKAIIGRCDLLVGSRTHAIIAALSQYIPVVALPYHEKFFGIMKMVGQEKYICDKITTESIMAKIDVVWNRRREIREQLEKEIKYIKELTLFQGKLVKDLLGEK